jgi:superfamily II DNA or RNA helicase
VGRVPSAWEESLGSLLGVPSAGEPSGSPLGIELTLAADPRRRFPATPRLLARVVRPGRNGWVSGGLGWSKLGSLHLFHEYAEPQVRLLQEIYAIFRSRDRRFAYGDDKTIDLSMFDSRQLWPVLDRAGEVGLRLVHGKKRLGPVEAYREARLCMDAVRGDCLVITPFVRIEGAQDVVPVRFLGVGGLVYVSRAELAGTGEYGDCRIGLARLAQPVAEDFQEMILRGRRLEIPAADEPRFADAYYPRLRHLAEIGSSDGTFTPPEISGPTLVLNASYGRDHDLELSWEWVYEVGTASKRQAVGAEPAVYRDLDREREILAGLDVELTEGRLQGVDTLRFTTEVLPLIEDRPGIEVSVSGEPADYREAGDSLQIGVSVTDLPGQTDWFDLGVSITVEGRRISFMTVFLALTKDLPYLILPDGAYFSLQKPQLRALHKLIIEARMLLDQTSDSLKISRFQAGLWDELSALGVVEGQAEAWQRQVGGLLAIDSVDPPDVPAGLAAELRPYQVTGFHWLAFLWECRLGGILADDMGLGKTLQALALFCHAKDRVTEPFLVVAPTSVVPNWESEARRFAPGLTVVSISDTLRRRRQPLAAIVAGADVVVTSYTLLRLDFEAYAKVGWAGMVLDEAQVTKNHQSKIYQCARKLPAPFKLAITGTPMENNLMELWSLLSITAPGLFPSPARFHEYYARPIERRAEPGLLAQLRRRVRPLVKRRTKDQVAADLPAKQEQILEVELHPKHRKVYQIHLQRERQKVLGLVQEMNRNRFTIFRSLTLLRRLSLHPGLVDEQHRDLTSAKVDALLEQLADVVAGGHRALVFSQFTSFLGIVRAQLDAAGVAYCYLDGSTSNRAKVLRSFKEGSAPVFLISLKAGGFGLNLTEADYCFILDPWWNPAAEAQAVDRTHRIGQTRNVMVYRLIAKATIEEKVMALKARKAALFANVMDDDNIFGAALTAEDIQQLFT